MVAARALERQNGKLLVTSIKFWLCKMQVSSRDLLNNILPTVNDAVPYT